MLCILWKEICLNSKKRIDLMSMIFTDFAEEMLAPALMRRDLDTIFLLDERVSRYYILTL